MELLPRIDIQKHLLRVHVHRVVPLELLVHFQLGHVHNRLVEDADARGTLGEEAGRDADRVYGEDAERVQGRKEKGGKGDDHGEEENREQVQSQPIKAAFAGQIPRDSLEFHHYNAHAAAEY